jgi:hypothetical protein
VRTVKGRDRFEALGIQGTATLHRTLAIGVVVRDPHSTAEAEEPFARTCVNMVTCRAASCLAERQGLWLDSYLHFEA